MFSTILTDDGAVSSDEELREGDDVATQDSQQRSNDRELKDQLLRKFGSHISSLKLEFSKKKKKGSYQEKQDKHCLIGGMFIINGHTQL